ncbi:MAG: cupin domain-containing protein [Bacteroidetes bacterium QS_9_68_14]|nr:MAG: cupin domain-containing protein [Bacteroidetes bacterium QS_9_68_14]
MADTSVKKVSADGSPQGVLGQTYLASGKKMSMRLWQEEPGEAQDKGPHARDYETVGYVIEGRATLHLEGQQVTLEEGDSWIVPEGAEHTYEVEERFKAVEATAPPARAHARDE